MLGARIVPLFCPICVLECMFGRKDGNGGRLGQCDCVGDAELLEVEVGLSLLALLIEPRRLSGLASVPGCLIGCCCLYDGCRSVCRSTSRCYSWYIGTSH